jgi:hypothetical protein
MITVVTVQSKHPLDTIIEKERNMYIETSMALFRDLGEVGHSYLGDGTSRP